jgi:hypothetical protein
LPAGEPVQERVDVPEPPVIDVEDKLQDRFVEFVVATRLTVPVNPLRGEIVIVEVAGVPAVEATVVGLAEIEKSGTAGVTVMVNATLLLTRVPDVALIIA